MSHDNGKSNVTPTTTPKSPAPKGSTSTGEEAIPPFEPLHCHVYQPYFLPENAKEEALKLASSTFDRPELRALFVISQEIALSQFSREMKLLDELMIDVKRAARSFAIRGRTLPSFPKWEKGDAEHYLMRLASVHNFTSESLVERQKFGFKKVSTVDTASKKPHASTGI
ncbi:hypothetical protein K435DRAFT_814614, partial [Dendrothele bispora CBS 962.96]